jgi:hypothetical protein
MSAWGYIFCGILFGLGIFGTAVLIGWLGRWVLR